MKVAILDTFYSWSLLWKREIIQVFIAFYILLAIILLAGGIFIYTGNTSAGYFKEFGLAAGKTAVVVFVLTLVPGIARRFGLKHKTISLLRIFRRYLGILVFMLVSVHAGTVAIVPRIPFLPVIVPFAVFELFGLAAYTILLFMFLTSNDLSVARLKIWWYRLHRFVYAVLGFVFLHTLLQDLNTWSVLMGSTVIIMAVSFLYEYMKKKNEVTVSS